MAKKRQKKPKPFVDRREWVERRYKIKTREERKLDLVAKYPPDKFNWWAFLFGVLYYWYHGMWGKGFLYLIISLVTLGLAAPILWIYMGFKHNKQYLEHNNIYLEI